MRRSVFGLFFLLLFALPLSARADSYLYTIGWNYVDSNPQYAHPEFVGTYSFTVDHLLTGMSCVYGPTAAIPLPSICSYNEASNFTTPPGSTVDMIDVVYYPHYSSPWNNQTSNYGVGVGRLGLGIGSSLFQSPFDPNSFYADFGSEGNISLRITPLNATPSVPEPSTFFLLGTGVLGVASRLRRRVSPSL